MEICEPSLLTRLPRVGLVENGSVQLAQVLGVSEGVKKKRNEVCAAVDGNSINVFEIVNGRNLSSIPVPPDATFLCPPCSTKSKTSADATLRRTYAVIKRRTKTLICCYKETKQGNSNEVQTSTYNLGDDSAKISLLQSSPDDREVLVMREDGTTTVFNDTVAAPISEAHLTSSSGDLKILAACWFSTRQATASLLKSRADVFTSFSQDGSVVAAVYENSLSNDFRLGVWTLPSETSEITAPLQPVLEHMIPLQSIHISNGTPNFTFMQDGTKLKAETTDMRFIFDLTAVRPTLVSNNKHFSQDRLLSQELPNNLELSVSNTQMSLVNTRYQTSLASLSNVSSPLKRKRGKSSLGDYISLVGYFPQHKRVIAHKENQLVSIDIRNSGASDQDFRSSSLLIGNIGKGTSPSTKHDDVKSVTGGTREHQQNGSVKWKKAVEALNHRLQSGQVEEFQQDFMSEMSGGTRYMPDHHTAVPAFKLDYLLSNLFELVEPEELTVKNTTRRLRLKLFCSELLRWLIEQGLLTSRRIVKSLSPESGNGYVPKLEPGAIVCALIEDDESLDSAQCYLQQSPYIPPEDLAVAVRVLVRKALQQDTKLKRPESRSGLLAGTSQPETQMSVTTFDDASASDVGVPVALSFCLLSALVRFGAIGQNNILAEIRSSMDRTDVLALIQTLRQHLFRGGHTRFARSTSHAAEALSQEEGASTQDNTASIYSTRIELPLSIIITLLSSCVDAIGPLGLPGSSENEEFIKTLIPDLLSEISSATMALEEGVYLQGLLRETLRYVESVQKHAPMTGTTSGVERNSQQIGAGTITTLYSEPGTDASRMSLPSALPVNLRADAGISRIKVDKGSGQSKERSKREMAMLQDRLRSAYSFERISV